jgi:hypothetical protein
MKATDIKALRAAEKARLSESLCTTALLIQELNGVMDASDYALSRARSLKEIREIALETARCIEASARSLESKAGFTNPMQRALAERSASYRRLGRACRELERLKA